jgi:glycosyltransferase involved in cell wall biosynthesis
MGKLLFVAPVLPVDVLETASILERNELLNCLVTRYSPDLKMAKVLAQSSFTKKFSKRPIAAVSPARKVESLLADLVYYATRPLSRTRATDLSFAVVDRMASRRVRKELGAVLAREDAATATFQRAGELGVKRIYALPTAYWRTVKKLMLRDEEEFPGICKAADDEARQARHREMRKDLELQMADFVLAPSTFVRESLSNAPGYEAQTKVLPFGCDLNSAGETTPQRKPVFLYAGNITMRKGVHRLLIAWKKLQAHHTAELRLIGDMFLDEKFLRDYQGLFIHIPRLSPSELQLHYQQSSALVFNAMADGFGYVIPEAMSCGVPVIASRNSGAPDIIENKADGILIDYGKDDQLEQAIDWAMTQPAGVASMGQAAREKVQRLTWQSYGEQLVTWLRTEVLPPAKA